MNICDYGCGRPALTQFKTGAWCCSKRTSACPENVRKRITARNESMRKIGDDGLSSFQRASNKIAANRGVEGYLAGATKMKQTKRNDIIDGLDCFQRTAKKTASTRLTVNPNSNLNSYQTGAQKAKETGYKNGHYHNPKYQTAFQSYIREVQKFTERSWKTMKHLIDPQGLKKPFSDYHLDQVFSKADGFDHDIQPELIGHWTNLQILTGSENLKKSRSSWKTCFELYNDVTREGN
jgi:hypothetical protein